MFEELDGALCISQLAPRAFENGVSSDKVRMEIAFISLHKPFLKARVLTRPVSLHQDSQ